MELQRPLCHSRFQIFLALGENQHVIFNILFLVVVTFRGIERSLKGQLLFWIWEVGFCNKWRENLNQIRHVHGHLIDSCVVEFFNVVQSAFVFVSDKVNGDSLTAETSTSTNSVKKKLKSRYENSVKQIFLVDKRLISWLINSQHQRQLFFKKKEWLICCRQLSLAFFT